MRRTFFDTARLLYVFDPDAWAEHAGGELPEWPCERARLVLN
jgi:hypothetical protein